MAERDHHDHSLAASEPKLTAPEDLMVAVYDQLRALAQQQLASERPGHTLSATALVHEAYLRLAAGRRVPWAAEAHFYAAAAEAMRRILIDHARARCAARRGGPGARKAALRLTELPDPASDEDCAGFLILDGFISRLESADPQAAAVVRLRYFAGLSIEATARALSVSEPTVKRAWTFARAWLKEAIERES
ncbi:MAG: sigma-70 family RNA polymerase sigma factor [Phycisphaerae bacterium]|jgi:RNA polymerase sigma factor (TIGR02999 family)|nr:sigma-70 family RNA polymerase sigma factor [Phycisphaerae bacterium]MCL4742954.1 sigma-70 family RNA polymerase sigma factor [Phycisphaerales bacterium]